MGAASVESENRQLPRAGWAVFVVLLGVIGYGFASVNHVKQTKLNGYPLVVADPSKLDFGERWEGEKFQWTVPIRNRTGAPIRLAKLTTSCGCTTPPAVEMLISPGETVDIPLRIEIPFLRSSVGTNRLRRVSLQDEDIGGRPRLLRTYLTGTITPFIHVHPGRISFDGPLVRGELATSERLRLSPATAIQELRVEPLPGVKPLLARLSGGDYLLAIRLRPNRPGNLDFDLNLTGIGPTGEAVGRSRLKVTTAVYDRVYAEPSEHHFGVVNSGETRTATISIVTKLPKTLRVVGWETFDPRVAISQIAAPVGAWRYRVSFLCDAAGEQQALIKFRTVLGEAEEIDVRAVVRAYGVRH